MKNILFISHDASRSGAPMVLLSFIKWLNKFYPNYKSDLVLLNGGPMVNEFENEVEKLYSTKNKHRKSILKKLLKKTYSILKLKGLKSEDVLIKEIVKKNYEIIYANTAISAEFSAKLKSRLPNSKFIVHIHELNSIIKTHTNNFKTNINKANQIIAVSNMVKDNLIHNYAVNSFKIDVVYPFPYYNFNSDAQPKKKQDFVVGMSGLSYWRKGNDIFIQVANYLRINYPDVNIRFEWVGVNNIDKIQIEEDIQKLSLSNVTFIGELRNPIEVYKNFDVFILTSREDPFPLVCIEIARLKKPIICFDLASGTSEVIKKGGGFVVPYLDIQEMVRKIKFYYENRNEIINDGEVAYKLFQEYNKEEGCPKLFNVLKDD